MWYIFAQSSSKIFHQNIYWDSKSYITWYLPSLSTPPLSPSHCGAPRLSSLLFPGYRRGFSNATLCLPVPSKFFPNYLRGCLPPLLLEVLLTSLHKMPPSSPTHSFLFSLNKPHFLFYFQNSYHTAYYHSRVLEISVEWYFPGFSVYELCNL